MPSTTGNQEPNMKPSLPSLHVRLPSTDSGIQADAGFDSLSRYKGKHFLSSSAHKMDSSNANVSSSVTSDMPDPPQSSIHSPCSSSSGYNSEARDSTPPTLPPRASKETTPPISASSSSRSSTTSSFPVRDSVPSAMTSSWAGATPFSKAKQTQNVEVQSSSKVSGSKENEAMAKMKSSIHIPPKPKFPPPKRPVVNYSTRPVIPSASSSAGSGVKMTNSQDGIQVSISRSNPSTQNASQISQTASQNSDNSQSQAQTTIDVRPSPGSTVKVKVISGGGARPQPQPRSTAGITRQGQGCIPLTRPLRIAPPSSTTVKRAGARLGAMSQPPPPPPHSEQLQQLQQRQQKSLVSYAGAKPRPLAPKPQVSPRKTFLASTNPPRPLTAVGNNEKNSSKITSTKMASAGTTSAVTTSTTSSSVTATQSNTLTSGSTTVTSSINTKSVPITSKSRNTPLQESASNIQIKSNHDHHVYKNCSASSPVNSPSSSTSPQTKNSVDSCTFMYKSPEKSFFTQTFYSKESSGKHSSESPASPASPAAFSSSSRPVTLDHRHKNLGFIREDLKSGDKQSRMRHAELILKRSDELFQDAWSFLNASDEEIDRCFFGDSFFKSPSPSPDRTTLSEIKKGISSSSVSRASDEFKFGKSGDVSLNSSVPPSSGSKMPSDLSMASDKGDSVSWKTRKERIDSALSWLKKELASLRDMDKNIVNQFRRCQDTIETLKSQREVWEGLSEEGEEAEYWDDLEINEFNRNYLNSPEGSSLSPMSTGSRDLSFQEVSTVVSLPIPQQSPVNGQAVSMTGSVTQDVEAIL